MRTQNTETVSPEHFTAGCSLGKGGTGNIWGTLHSRGGGVTPPEQGNAAPLPCCPVCGHWNLEKPKAWELGGLGVSRSHSNGEWSWLHHKAEQGVCTTRDKAVGGGVGSIEDRKGLGEPGIARVVPGTASPRFPEPGHHIASWPGSFVRPPQLGAELQGLQGLGQGVGRSRVLLKV